MTEEPQKEEAPAGPKKILEELEKSAASEAVPVPAPAIPEVSEPPLPAVPSSGPLITDAMRRLDDLLTRLRGNS